MGNRVPTDGGGPKFYGRTAECAALDRLLLEAQAGRSQVLVLRGDPGIGKTALLDYLAERASGWRVLRAAGVQSEMELPFAGLHQLCAPLLDRLHQLPGPQATALATAFGLEAGDSPSRFLVGLAVLSLLAEAAEEEPVACIVDDAQWLDGVSAQTLGFLARRLLAERVALVFAVRQGSAHELDGLAELTVPGLGVADARALLNSVLTGPVDERVREQIVAETGGNPLALLELTSGLTPMEFAGGFGLPELPALPARIEQTFVRRLDTMSGDARRLLLVAAAEPMGDPLLVWRAAERLGIATAAADHVKAQGLLEIRERVIFRHPLVRSAIYRSAAVEDRRAAHLALAEAIDREAEPDRRAWHLAAATPGPDEEVALEVERSAGRARARGGVAAAAAFLQRAVELGQNPAHRADRALAAAQASFQAGAFDAVLRLLATAEANSLDESQRAQVDLLRGHVAFASGLDADAPTLLLKAAKRLEAVDPDAARETYLAAWRAANMAGQGGVALEICRAARALPRTPGGSRPLARLLDAVALLMIDGRAAAAPMLQRVTKDLAEIAVEDVIRWGSAGAATAASWDIEGWRALNERHVQLVRDAGALAQLPLRLMSSGIASAWVGDFAGAASAIAESESVAAATGGRIAPYASLRLRALQGREVETSALIAAALEQAAAGGQGMVAIHAHWAAAVLCNGLARYEQAAAAARQATSNTFEPWVSMWGLPELIEAATRAGDVELAREALERLEETTRPSGVDFGLGIEARCRALVSDGIAADELFSEAIERLQRTKVRPELARAHLLYGEWLRREGRRIDAREQLRTAFEMLTAMGMEGFGERARRELTATGLKVRKRSPETRDELTPQEEQIARLARDGLSNPEIGAQLFLSPRTVEWHLHKVFGKLGISSRKGLRGALRGSEGELIPI